MTRKNCRGCESEHVALFIDLGDMPMAGGFLLNTEAIKNEKVFPLPVHVWYAFGLLQKTWSTLLFPIVANTFYLVD